MPAVESIKYVRYCGRAILGCDASGDPAERRAALAVWPATNRKRRLVKAVLMLGTRWIPWRNADAVALQQLSLQQLNEVLEWAGVNDSPTSWLLFWPGQADRNRLYIRYRKADTYGLIKVATDRGNRKNLEHEAGILKGWQDLQKPFRVPSVLGARSWGESIWALHLGGWPIATRSRSDREAAAAADQVQAFLASQSLPTGALAVGATDWHADFCVKAPPGEWAAALQGDSDRKIPVAWAHGDLGPGNMAVTPDGDLLVYDWESASSQAPLHTDGVAFWLSARQRRILRNPQPALAQLFKEWSGLNRQEIGWILAFLTARDNIAAKTLLKCRKH